MRTLERCWVMALMIFLLSGGCAFVGGIEVDGDSNNGNNGGGTTTCEELASQVGLNALAGISQVPHTRATLSWAPPSLSLPSGAQSEMVYRAEVSDEGVIQERALIEVDCQATECRGIIPDLEVEKLFEVRLGFLLKVTVAQDDEVIDCALTAPLPQDPFNLDTAWKQKQYVGGTIKQLLGWASEVGDVNGDGAPDLLWRGGGSAVDFTPDRRVDLFLGGPERFLDDDEELVPAASFRSSDDDLSFSAAMQLADVTCQEDGLDEVIISESSNEVTGFGKVFIWEGGYLSGDHFSDESDFTIAGTTSDARFGQAVAAANQDGSSNGCHEMLIGMPYFDANTDGDFEGLLLELPDPLTADLLESDLSEFYLGGLNEYAGWFAWPIGDVHGDGQEDVLFSSKEDQSAWPLRAITFRLASDKNVDFIGPLPFFPGATIRAHEGLAGSLGDINGDGFEDFFLSLGTESSGVDSGGVVRIFPGGASVESVPEFEIFNDTQVSFGMGVAFGDYDVDGVDELLIGSSSRINVYESPSLSDGADGTVAYDGEDLPGFGIKLIDFNGDHYLDIMVGNPNYDSGDLAHEGTVTLLY